MASPRGIVPGLFSDDQLFQPLLPGFEKYPKESFDFIEGAASAVDVEKTVVVIKTNAGPLQTLQYDILVIATGASSVEHLPFKQEGSHKDTLVVGGAGTTGVETAGELGFEYYGKGKSITLITSSAHVLPSLREDVGAFAENELRKLNVEIIPNTKVTAAVPHGETQTELTLSTGTTLHADLYIPTIGLYPNTSFLPPNLLKPPHSRHPYRHSFRVLSTPPNTVFAAGDRIGIESKQIKHTEDQAVQLAGNLDVLLTDGGEEMMKEYVPSNMQMIALTVGRSKGTGIVAGWRLWSWVVWALKGRSMGTQKLGRLAKGEGLVVSGWV